MGVFGSEIEEKVEVKDTGDNTLDPILESELGLILGKYLEKSTGGGGYDSGISAKLSFLRSV